MTTAVKARPRWSRADRELVGLVSFSHALQHVYVAVLPLTYPLAVVEFHTSYTALGLLLGIVAAVGGFLQGGAFLYQRLAARFVLALQNLLMAATAVMIAVAPNFAVFGTGRFLGAVVSSPQHPVGNAVLARAFPERSGTVLSWHTTGGNVGTLVVPLIASLLIARWGWRTAVLAAAIPIAVGGLLLWARMREPAPERRPQVAGEGSASVGRVLRTRAAAVVLVASTIAAGGRGLGVVNGYVPAYLSSGLHLNQLLVGVIFTVVLAGSVAGPVASGMVADRVGRRIVVVITYVLGGAALAAFGMSGPNLALLLVFGLLVGVFAYAESPLLQALWADATRGAPQQAAFGAYFAISYGAGSAWIAILGWTIDHLGFTATFWIMGASFLVATAVLTLAPRRLSGATPAPA